MRNFICCIISILWFSAAAQDIGTVFYTLNSDNLRWIDATSRKSLIAKYKESGADSIQNVFGDWIRLEVYDETNHFLRIKTSDAGSIELKMFPTGKGHFITGLCFTACAPICDSHITFFDEHQNLIESELFSRNTIANFIDIDTLTATEKSKKKKSEMTNRFVEKLTIIFNELHFAQNENKITLTHDFESYLDKDLYKELKPYLKGNSMDFVWDNNIFNPQNTYWK